MLWIDFGSCVCSTGCFLRCELYVRFVSWAGRLWVWQLPPPQRERARERVFLLLFKRRSFDPGVLGCFLPCTAIVLSASRAGTRFSSDFIPAILSFFRMLGVRGESVSEAVSWFLGGGIYSKTKPIFLLPSTYLLALAAGRSWYWSLLPAPGWSVICLFQRRGLGLWVRVNRHICERSEKWEERSNLVMGINLWIDYPHEGHFFNSLFQSCCIPFLRLLEW